MVVAVSLSILALAAGVHLLIKVKQAGLGKLYKGLAWLVIVMAFAFNICLVVCGAMHHRHHGCHRSEMNCQMRPGCMPGDANCTMHMEGGHCQMNSGEGHCNMAMDSTGHCKMKDGDSTGHCKMKEGEGHSCPYMKDSTKK